MSSIYRTLAVGATDGTTRICLGEVTVDEVIEVVRALRGDDSAEVVERDGKIYVDGAVAAEAITN